MILVNESRNYTEGGENEREVVDARDVQQMVVIIPLVIRLIILVTLFAQRCRGSGSI